MSGGDNQLSANIAVLVNALMNIYMWLRNVWTCFIHASFSLDGSVPAAHFEFEYPLLNSQRIDISILKGYW